MSGSMLWKQECQTSKLTSRTFGPSPTSNDAVETQESRSELYLSNAHQILSATESVSVAQQAQRLA